MGNTSQVTSTPPSSPLKCGRLILMRTDVVVVVFFWAWLPMAPLNQGHLQWKKSLVIKTPSSHRSSTCTSPLKSSITSGWHKR
jgi:hypothetical protein